ncbi:MAG TPA: hypothetical protein VG938_02525 [Verrucomicrobiae bacterium]|nr:hypothetical protein [Verrucomicrobiae bacterium]
MGKNTEQTEGFGTDSAPRADKYFKWFILSAGVILLVAAIAKIVSAVGKAKILETPDPVLTISRRNLMFAAGIVEILLCWGLVVLQRKDTKIAILTLFASACLGYKIALLWIAPGALCPCLGNVTDALPISPHVLATAENVILGYLLLGAYGLAAFHYWLNFTGRNSWR